MNIHDSVSPIYARMWSFEKHTTRLLATTIVCLALLSACQSKKEQDDLPELTEFATRYAAAWSSQDPVALTSFYAKNGSFRINDGELSVGRDAIAETAGSFMTAFPDMVVRLVELRQTDDYVEFHWHWTGTNTGPGGTGNAVDLRGYEQWTLDEDGLILKSRGNMDDAEYQRQLNADLPKTQIDDFDYFSANRTLIRNGVQAILMCNGLFTSGRTLEQVFEQELAYLPNPVGTADGGEYLINPEPKSVSIGGTESGPVITAAYREGIGCVVMAPNQGVDDIDSLPILKLPYPDSNPSSMPWPVGDVVEQESLPDNVDLAALSAASGWAFDRESPEQVTLSLIVVHKGDIIHERYADGVDMMTRTRTWSTAKSIATTLIGMLVDDGRLELDAPLGIEWLPDVEGPDDDPRDAITLRHVLNMSSGLYPVDSFGMEYATGSGLAYWAGASSVDGARRRALIRKPGTFWDYENYDTLLAVYAMKLALGDRITYATFPRKALLDRIGMRNTLISTDRFGDFIFSSQVYTTARDLARFGLLYLQNGVWEGERLISEDWIDFVRTPAPSTAHRGNMYGGQFWLVPDERDDVPKSAYSTAGNRGQYVVIVPTHDTVIVRRGLDYGRQGFNRWDLTREVLKAIEVDSQNGD